MIELLAALFAVAPSVASEFVVPLSCATPVRSAVKTMSMARDAPEAIVPSEQLATPAVTLQLPPFTEAVVTVRLVPERFATAMLTASGPMLVMVANAVPV